MKTDRSKLFDSEGYIPIKEYTENIYDMLHNGPWKLPLKAGDRFHLGFLRFFSKISWFSDRVFIQYAEPFSPAYAVLLSYLKKRGIFDSLWDRSISQKGYYSFMLKKTISIGEYEDIMYGQGVSTDKATALSIAMGEMIERAVTGMHDENRTTRFCSAEDLEKENKKILFPPKFHRFLDIQKKTSGNSYFDERSKMFWVKGKNILTKEDIYIPKKMTSWFKENRKGKDVLVHATTNGSAGYFSKEEAVLKGMLEVIQRDGFLVHWLTTIAPDVIEKEGLPDALQEMTRRLEERNISIHVLNITSLGIPSVAVVAIGKSISGEPQIVVSAASALSFYEAIEAAQKEIVLGLETFSIVKESADAAVRIEPFVSSLDKMGRQLYWRGEEKIRRFEWFISGKKTTYASVVESDIQSKDDASDKIKRCVHVLQAFGEGYVPVVYHPTNTLQEDLGFFIAQVFIPKAFPLYLVEKYGTFDSDRLQEFAASKGKDSFSLNSEPHMFS